MEYDIKLDIAKGELCDTPLLVLTQGERGHTVLNITILEDGQDTSWESGTTFTFVATRPDGRFAGALCEVVSLDKGTLRLPVPSELTGESGHVAVAYIEARVSDDVVATTGYLPICILRGADMTAEEAEGYVPFFEQFSSNEMARVLAEEARVAAEAKRASAESARVSAEKSRASAESSRVSAESSRVAAEKSRVSAEAARAESFKEWLETRDEVEVELSYVSDAIAIEAVEKLFEGGDA